jgi:hypothetical protein
MYLSGFSVVDGNTVIGLFIIKRYSVGVTRYAAL